MSSPIGVGCFVLLVLQLNFTCRGIKVFDDLSHVADMPTLQLQCFALPQTFTY